MIHVCLDRLWYVEKYLMPSMIAQGIDKTSITLYLDTEREGCLKSCIKSFETASKMDVNGVWHLQDDVIICRDFKERTEKFDDGLVCGFSSFYDKAKGWLPGESNGLRMWYSFPCIRIPTYIIREYVQWFNTYVWRDHQYDQWTKKNKYDDTIWRIWMEQYHPSTKVLNLSPNLVDHVDYFLGGSTINQRDRQVRSLSFEDTDLVKNLERRLKNDLSKRKN